jgi:hypothetical protein
MSESPMCRAALAYTLSDLYHTSVYPYTTQTPVHPHKAHQCLIDRLDRDIR